MAKRPKTKQEADTGRLVTAPSVRVFTTWDPLKIRAAERQAESGYLDPAASVCEWLLGDDRVDGTLSARVNALLGLKPSFEPSGDKRRSNRAVKALEAGEDYWAAYPESELALMLKWGILLGVAPLKHGWVERADHGNRVLPMPRFWHPQTLKQDGKTQQWTVRDSNNNELVVVPGDGEWILHTPYGLSRPWASGKWRSLARWVLLKHYAIYDWARHGEKSAMLVATSNAASTDKQRAQLTTDLANSGADRIVALAAGFDLKLVEVTANTLNIYNAQISAANEAIAILIRGGNLTTNVTEGSRAAAEVQERKGDGANLRFDAETLCTTLNEQSLALWAEFNFGDRALAPWPVYPVEPEEDKKARVEMIDVAADAIDKLEKLGFIIDDAGVVEELDLAGIVKGRKTPEQRDADKAAAFEQQKALMPANGTEPAKPPPKKTPPPKAKAGGFVAALASGAPISENPGMVAGQLFVDSVVESAAELADAALEPTHEAIGRALDEATGFEDLRERLQALYPTLPADELNELMFRVMSLGELAGRRSVIQDT